MRLDLELIGYKLTLRYHDPLGTVKAENPTRNNPFFVGKSSSWLGGLYLGV